MQKGILFVDDEPHLLQGLRRMMHPMRHVWKMAFAADGYQALEMLAHTPVDVVVSDMRMPGMDGAQLLQEIRQSYPHTVRIVLSGHSDREMTLRSVGPTHQYLAKPCDTEILKTTITRISTLQSLLPDATLQRVVAGIQTLPSFPGLYMKVQEAMQGQDVSLEVIGKLIEQDIGMTAKILQLVNSAFFGLRCLVSSPAQAVNLLGLETVQALILSVKIFVPFGYAQIQEWALETFWEHSLRSSLYAQYVAKEATREKKLIEEAYLAGLLHDVGKLVLATTRPELYKQVLALSKAERLRDWEAEQAILGTTHAEVGGYLLGLWGLADAVVEAVAYHHRPSSCSHSTFTPLTAVHIANALDQEIFPGSLVGPLSSLIDHIYIRQLDLQDRLRQWRKDCECIAEQEYLSGGLIASRFPNGTPERSGGLSIPLLE